MVLVSRSLVLLALLVAAPPAMLADFNLPRGEQLDFGTPPEVVSGPLSAEVERALDAAFGSGIQGGSWGAAQFEAVGTIARAEDARIAWLVSDLMRVVSDQRLSMLLSALAGELLGITVDPSNPWGFVTNRLIAWDIPAPPGYLPLKRNIYSIVEPAWRRLFVTGDIDWRHVSWGGVRIDDRAYNKTDELCNCIPAADNPATSDAASATWLADDDVVFGIGINGEYRAYPRRIMEVREMVNDTLGGRSLGIPYCTLCGSAQAYLTDELPDGVERPVLRTSGLLIRSNKVMFDINTYSVFDTFKGRAVTGPLAEIGLKLKRIGVVTTTWGAWKATHPDTTVLVEALALGKDFDFRNTRDANGPIFPIGATDPRLPVQEEVIGVLTSSGQPIAFHLGSARAALERAEKVSVDGIRLILDGGGIKALTDQGEDAGAHQAFWFAWSQFYPATRLWPSR